MIGASSKKAFTIVELLIVIVVIAILAAISIVAYNGIQQRSTNSKNANEAVQAAKLLESYYQSTTNTHLSPLLRFVLVLDLQTTQVMQMATVGTHMPADRTARLIQRLTLHYRQWVHYQQTTLVASHTQQQLALLAQCMQLQEHRIKCRRLVHRCVIGYTAKIAL